MDAKVCKRWYKTNELRTERERIIKIGYESNPRLIKALDENLFG